MPLVYDEPLYILQIADNYIQWVEVFTATEART